MVQIKPNFVRYKRKSKMVTINRNQNIGKFARTNPLNKRMIKLLVFFEIRFFKDFFKILMLI